MEAWHIKSSADVLRVPVSPSHQCLKPNVAHPWSSSAWRSCPWNVSQDQQGWCLCSAKGRAELGEGLGVSQGKHADFTNVKF